MQNHLVKNSKKLNFEALPTEWKPINKNCIILQLNGTAIKNSKIVLMGFNGDIFVLKVLSVSIFCMGVKLIFWRKWGWNIKISIKINTWAKIYAVGINTGTLITKNKTEMDKNVHKVAQGLTSEWSQSKSDFVAAVH